LPVHSFPSRSSVMSYTGVKIYQDYPFKKLLPKKNFTK